MEKWNDGVRIFLLENHLVPDETSKPVPNHLCRKVYSTDFSVILLLERIRSTSLMLFMEMAKSLSNPYITALYLYLCDNSTIYLNISENLMFLLLKYGLFYLCFVLPAGFGLNCKILPNIGIGFGPSKCFKNFSCFRRFWK